MKNQFNGKKQPQPKILKDQEGRVADQSENRPKIPKTRLSKVFSTSKKMTFLTKKIMCQFFSLSRIIEAKSYFGKKVSTQKLEAWHQNLVGFET